MLTNPIKQLVKSLPIVPALWRKARQWIMPAVVRYRNQTESTPWNDLPQDAFLFFLPEAGLVPHLASLCVLAKTLKEKGYPVAFVRCTGIFSRCPILDALNSPKERSRGCTSCNKQSLDFLREYDLPAVNLADEVSDTIKREAESVPIPGNPADFQYDGIPMGRAVGYDLSLKYKIIGTDSLTPEVNDEWTRYLRNGIKVYLSFKEIVRKYRPRSIVVYNDYYLAICAVSAAERAGVRCFSVGSAYHRGNDRRNPIVWPHLTGFQGFHLIKAWDSWKGVPLTPEIVREIGEDILFRLNARGVHVYSKKKSLTRSSLLEDLARDPRQKTIVAYTSSLCETVATTIAIESTGKKVPHYPQPFKNQVEWLRGLVEYTERNAGVRLVIRIHPREDVNHRDGVRSQHMEQLKAALSRLPDRATVLWPQDPTSSYDLGEMADVVTFAWSTIGLEFARLGVPALQALRTYYPYPTEGVFFWEDTAESYFRTLTNLLAHPPPAFPIIQNAFRWYHLQNMGARLNIEDVIPTPDYGGLPKFRAPLLGDELESIILKKRTGLEINLEKLQKSPHGDLEESNIRAQLARTLHFLVTGREVSDVSDVSSVSLRCETKLTRRLQAALSGMDRGENTAPEANALRS